MAGYHGAGGVGGAPLQGYVNRSVWTTWTLSYKTIYETHKPAANLLLFWAFLDYRDLWYGIFEAACQASGTIVGSLSK